MKGHILRDFVVGNNRWPFIQQHTVYAYTNGLTPRARVAQHSFSQWTRKQDFIPYDVDLLPYGVGLLPDDVDALRE